MKVLHVSFFLFAVASTRTVAAHGRHRHRRNEEKGVNSALFGEEDHHHHDHHHHDHNHGHRDLDEESPFERCGTRTLDPEEKIGIQEEMRAWMESDPILSETTVTIPTVWHIIRASDGTGGLATEGITASMAVLNAAFASSGFSFNLIETTITNNDNYNTNAISLSEAEAAMKAELRQGDAETLNIYSAGELGGGSLLGYATFPSDLLLYDLNFDGVVIAAGTVPGGSFDPYNEGDTLVHEVGHWLGLFHVFSDCGRCSEPGVDDGCNDQVDDTPVQSTPSYTEDPDTCDAGKDSCPGRWPGLDSVTNYMDYSDDACLTEFTQGQNERMAILWNLYRKTAITSAPTVAPCDKPNPCKAIRNFIVKNVSTMSSFLFGSSDPDDGGQE